MTDTQPQTADSSQDTSTETHEISLDTEQQLAVQLCMDMTKRIVSVTGPAGTGKTTVLKTTYENYTRAGYSVALCALAGKAAKRIQEVTGFPASTIHRLYEFSMPGEIDEKTGKPYGESVPKRNMRNHLPHDVIFVDEYTMVNSLLHRQIIDGMKPGALLRCFGDINQLPPIEENKEIAKLPSPFKDILTRFPSVTLKKLHRQGEGSDIAINANRILYSMCPVRKPNFELVITNDPVNKLKEILADNQDIDFQSIDNQIITPQNTTWIGAVRLNGALQPMFHETMAGAVPIPRNKWEEKIPIYIKDGDKVLWTKNNYDLNIFNGETGIIKAIYDDGSLEINWGDRTVIVPVMLTYTRYGITHKYDPRKALQLAYAITTHKAQGSEYQNVIYIINKSVFMMLNRPNFYTGVTRARKKVWLISDQTSMQIAASTARSRI